MHTAGGFSVLVRACKLALTVDGLSQEKTSLCIHGQQIPAIGLLGSELGVGTDSLGFHRARYWISLGQRQWSVIRHSSSLCTRPRKSLLLTANSAVQSNVVKVEVS